MKYQHEAGIVYNNIKSKSGLNDDQLTILGITKEKLSKSISQCIAKGMSLKQAIVTVIKLWNNANPDVQAAPATPKEMTMMGFELVNDQWKHSDYDITITQQEQQTLSFKEVEAMVLAKQSVHRSPHQDKQTE